MKFIFSILTLTIASTVFAGQTFSCREINRSGSVKNNGGSIKLRIETKSNGDVSDEKSLVKVINFTRDPDYFVSSNPLSVVSANESKMDQETAYTIIFMNDNEGMLDVQLQFQSRVMGRGFNAERAVLVIGSDDANPETGGFATGYDVVCSSRVN